jgi:hypothetical protein
MKGFDYSTLIYISFLGSCDIRAEQNILVMNEMKRYGIQLKPKALGKKNFRNLLPNFVKGLNKSWLKYRPFCMKES